ncbi:MAG: hypothetical protein HZA54_20735, partial [Planctomycetes bacterium]|nr:hypothetical protein [Planctomycetota bacterium]
AVAQDGSLSIDVPEGWTFEGAGLGFSTCSDADRRRHGAVSTSQQFFVPEAGVALPGVEVKGYLPPVQALAHLGSKHGVRDVEVLSESALEEVDPEAARQWRPWQAQGAQVDSRVLYLRFHNGRAGETARGIYIVTCVAAPMAGAWTCFANGCWAPEAEFVETWLPVFVRMTTSAAVNDSWVAATQSRQAAETARLNGGLMKSIAASQHSFDRYLGSLRDAGRSRDYTNWAYSQTTLGQGNWVSEMEGAEVVRTHQWGLEERQTGQELEGRPWNTTNFTGRNPWSGEDLEAVDTRAEYEKYLSGK